MSLRTDTGSAREAAGDLFAVFVLSILLSVWISPALGADQVHDEIQVYNAGIAAVGQWTYQQHLNYAAIGQTVSEVPGVFIPIARYRERLSSLMDLRNGGRLAS